MRARARPVLITGGAGFIGANLADRLASAGRQVIILDSLARPGVEANVDWLTSRHGPRVVPVASDVRDRRAVEAIVAETDQIVHLAAQVAVTTSMSAPMEDFLVNALGTLTILEAARRRPEPPAVLFASTNKVYGDLGSERFSRSGGRFAPEREALARGGVDESSPLDLHTPYGCSKGAADQYVLEYARRFRIPAAVLRMSCIYGPRQLGTEDQGWVAHFLMQARAGRPITVYGDGRQVRDVLHVDDAVDAYVALLDDMRAVAGRAFNLGGGPANAVSLLEMIAAIEDLLGRPVSRRHAAPRPGDQPWFVADTRRIEAAVGWRPRSPWREGLASLDRWIAGSSLHVGETAA